MFSCFTDLGLPTTFSGYDLLDYASTRSLVPATSEHESETVLPRAAALSPAAARASQSNGFLKSIRSFFAWCFSCWLPSAKPRAAAADRNGNAVGQSEPGKCDSQSDDNDLFEESEHARLHRLSAKNRDDDDLSGKVGPSPYDSEDEEEDAIQEAEEKRIKNLIDDLDNNGASSEPDEYGPLGSYSSSDSDSDSEDENS